MYIKVQWSVAIAWFHFGGLGPAHSRAVKFVWPTRHIVSRNPKSTTKPPHQPPPSSHLSRVQASAARHVRTLHHRELTRGCRPCRGRRPLRHGHQPQRHGHHPHCAGRTHLRAAAVSEQVRPIHPYPSVLGFGPRFLEGGARIGRRGSNRPMLSGNIHSICIPRIQV